MTIRITGMNSGLDTETIINELASAKSVKIQSYEKEKTRLSWKIDAWQSLNTKIYGFYTDVLTDMRFSSAYSKLSTKVSNEGAVSIITGSKAIRGTQKLNITQLAKTGYLTGAEITRGDGKEVEELTTLKELGFQGNAKLNLTIGGETKELEFSADSTINDVVKELTENGLNANFDTATKRIFVSAGDSGEQADFTITAGDSTSAQALSMLGLNTEVLSYSKAEVEAEKLAEYKANYELLLKGYEEDAAKEASSFTEFMEAVNNNEAEVIATLGDDLDAEVAAMFTDKTDATYDTLTTEEKEQFWKNLDRTKREAFEDKLTASDNEDIKAIGTKLETYSNAKEIASLSKGAADSAAQMLTFDGDGNVTGLSAEAQQKVDEYYDSLSASMTGAKAATKIDGQDAKIHLNGAEFQFKSNTFEINGLTYNVSKVTDPNGLDSDDSAVLLETETDTSGIYDMIGNFVTKYNELIKEIDTLYGAADASDYDPLTSDEKKELSEKEVEEWEKKIKDSILRKDSTLSTISSALKEVMLSGFEVTKADGTKEKMYLSSFGISTLSYFDAKDGEKNVLHIDGNPDDTETKNNADKLKTAIANDPEMVTQFFSALNNALYGKVDELMERKTDYSSAYKVYNDVQMNKELTEYDEKIRTAQEKLNDYMDRWYSKFSDMEVALAKLDSKSSAISNMLGM